MHQEMSKLMLPFDLPSRIGLLQKVLNAICFLDTALDLIPGSPFAAPEYRDVGLKTTAATSNFVMEKG